MNVGFEYLTKGLNALSRAHRVNSMAGHLGAAVLAGCFIGEQHPDLDPKVYAGIEGELERIVRGESVFSPRSGAAITVEEMFAALPRERPEPGLIDGIAAALVPNIDGMRESGHNVIFAAIAIRALKDHPDLATPTTIDGIRALIAGFDGAGPGSGYYGKQKGRIDGREVPLPRDDCFPPYAHLQAMASVVLHELIQKADRRLPGYGGLWHVINHGAALLELAHYGFKELALAGLLAHHQHVRLLRTLPDLADELGAETPTRHHPRTPTFWQPYAIRRERAHLTHRIKTLYGLHLVAQAVEDRAMRHQAADRLRYLM